MRELAKHFKPSEVLLGFNPNQNKEIQNPSTGEIFSSFSDALNMASSMGFHLHVYLEGPLGPTGDEITPEEKLQRESHIKNSGSRKNNGSRVAGC